MLSLRTLLALLIGGSLCATSAQAGTGTCVVKGMPVQQAATVLAGTYGLVGQGTVTNGGAVNFPTGTLTQEGTLAFTQVAQGDTPGQLTATYALNLSQVSSSNGVTTYSNSGRAVINTADCTAVLDNGNPYARLPAFALTFINGGTAVVMAGATPGVFVTYMSAQKE